MSNTIFFPNILETATGTNVGGKKSLDVFVSGGTLTFTEAAIVADGGALPALIKVVGGYDGTNVQVIKTNTTGMLEVVQPDTISTGSITSTQSVTLAVNGLSSAGVQITGIWSGTLTLESSVDGVNFNTTSGVPLTGGTIASNFSSNNIFQVNLSGMNTFRIRGNTIASGTAVITVRGNATTGPIVLSEPLPNGGNVIGSVGQSGAWSVTSSDAGLTKANAPTRNNYASVNVTTAAYVQLVASTTSATKEVSIFDSSGQTLILALGAAASEVDHMLVFPGGNGREKWAIPAGSRVSIKAVSATASVGEISINFWG